MQVIKQKYPAAVSSKSVKDKDRERKSELKRKPGQGSLGSLESYSDPVTPSRDGAP
jgi:hypothetical protein